MHNIWKQFLKNGASRIYFCTKKNNPISDAIVDYYLGRKYADLIDFYYYYYSLVQFQLSHCAIKKTCVHIEQNQSQKWQKNMQFLRSFLYGTSNKIVFYTQLK